MLNIDYLNAIKEYMQLHEVKQNRLAKLLQVSANTVTNWMNGGVISDRHRVRIFQLCGKPKKQGALIPAKKADELSGNTADASLFAILNAIMISDMCDGCKVKAYNIVKGILKPNKEGADK